MVIDRNITTRQRVQGALRYVLEPVLPFLDDPLVTDVNCNADGKVWIGKVGRREFTGVILSPVQAEQIINIAASGVGQVCNVDTPELHCELAGYNARLQGTVPPITMAPTFDIRRFSDEIYRLEDYVTAGIMRPGEQEILEKAVAERKSLLIAGSTGSGKTTLLNALLALPCIQDDRIIILEDTPEIHCTVPDREHMLSSARIPMSALVMIALRKAPTRIIVGEAREGAVAMGLLEAGNTGHPGWMSTLHANSALDALYRLDQLTQQVCVTSQCHFVARNVDYVVYLKVYGASRRVEEIVRVQGYADGRFHVEAV